MAVSTTLRQALVEQGHASLVLPQAPQSTLGQDIVECEQPQWRVKLEPASACDNLLAGLPGMPMSCNRYGGATPPASNFENPYRIMLSVLGRLLAFTVGVGLWLDASDEACEVSTPKSQVSNRSATRHRET
jgi:hypothetical protein